MSSLSCVASKRFKQIPTALTIAGSDSGGGAGIQADLKTFASLGVHGTSAITCLTAQNPKGVSAVEPTTPRMVRSQLEAIFAELRPRAVKTGMLFSKEIILTVANFLQDQKTRPPLIIDPVMISTSGAQLLKTNAVDVLKNKLFPLASLITPNLDEAEALLNTEIRSVEAMRLAAKKLHAQFGCAVLMKGGHLRDGKEAVDIFVDGKEELLLSAPFVKGVSTHGTGCTYSAAIAGHLALGKPLVQAVIASKEYITQAIAQSRQTGGHFVLNSFWEKP
ncbi:MAG: thiD [Verrucomicrobiales bacterium]|nr:thiD [Verrucomicrobiales bacterium]